jgi:hypothetical protein
METHKKKPQTYRWAVDEYVSKARPVSRVDQADPEMAVLWIPTATLLRLTETGQRTSLKADKLARAVAFWEKGGFMEPPVVSLYGRHIVFADGRHRTVAAKTLGITHVPVVVPKEEAGGFRTLLSGSRRQPLLSSG